MANQRLSMVAYGKNRKENFGEISYNKRILDLKINSSQLWKFVAQSFANFLDKGVAFFLKNRICRE